MRQDSARQRQDKRHNTTRPDEMLKNKPRPRQDEDDKRKADKAKKRQDKDKMETRKDKTRLHRNNARADQDDGKPKATLRR